MQATIAERTMAMAMRLKCNDGSRTQSEEQGDESRDRHHHTEN